MERSPAWKNGHFENPEPLVNDFSLSMSAMFHPSPDSSPQQRLEVPKLSPHTWDEPPKAGLRVTWFGHASTLVEIDGIRVLTDPMWSHRPSPISWVGPERWFDPPIALADLPPIDAVVISHDHYDHLDYGSIVAMRDWKTPFIVPLGVGAHLAYWGIPEERIIELDWWERTRIGNAEIVCTPSRHASGRTLLDRDSKLWGSYAIVGPTHRVFFSGDTGLHRAMRDIGERLGPFDLTMLEVGQYHQAWPDWHMGPEQAVEAHRRVRGKTLLPIHWGLVSLAPHSWTEPIERVTAEAARTETRIVTPKLAEPLEIGGNEKTSQWWPKLDVHTGKEDPIVSRHAD